MEDFVRNHSDIGLDWYVPNLVNTHVKDLIKINPGESMIVFNSTELSEFFTRSCYKLNLQTGRVYTYFLPAEDIRIQCQQQEFDLNLHREHFQKHIGQAETPAEELKRVPLVKKKAPTAETMDLEEIEEKKWKSIVSFGNSTHKPHVKKQEYPKSHKRKQSRLAKYSMCTHSGALKQFFGISTECTIQILVVVNVITFLINLLYFWI